MIAPLIAVMQMFASLNPAEPLRDLQAIRARSFDLRVGTGSLLFEAAAPVKCQYISFSTYALWDGNSLGYIQVYQDFPSFFSDASVTNHDRGLDLYTSVD